MLRRLSPPLLFLRALYLWYAYRMGNVRRHRKGGRRIHYLLREDLYKLEMRERITRLLVENRIETFDQLYTYRTLCNQSIEALCARRKALQKSKKSPQNIEALAAIREQLKTLRREGRLCDKIEEDSKLIQQKREALRAEERKLNSKDAPARPRRPVR